MIFKKNAFLHCYEIKFQKMDISDITINYLGELIHFN